jgi:cell division protein FtsA
MRAAARVDTRPETGLLVLDLGAHKALALAVVPVDERIEVRGWAERACALTSQGMLVDLDAARQVLAEVLAAAAAQARRPLRRVVVGVAGSQVRCVPAQGSVRTKMPVILQAAHLDRALDAAADIGLPSDHEVLHVLPSAYRVDGARVVRSPLGMRARNVTADAVVVTVRSQVLDTVQRALEGIGYELVGAAAEPLAAARAALSTDDRRRGAVLVDIGAEGTAAVSYRDGVVRGMACVPAGGSHVTRDIAFALQLDVAHAEALKRRAGHALMEGVPPDRQVEVRRGRERLSVGQQMLAGIIEERMDELLGLVRDGLQAQSALGLGDRIVLAGGGARLRGAVDLAEQVFASPARLASPDESWGWREAAGDPACCTALGLVEYAVRSGLLRDEPPAPWTRALSGLRRVVDESRGGVRGALRLGRPRRDRNRTSVHA